MSSKVVVTDTDITNCIKQLISLAEPLKVDEKGYIRRVETDELVLVTSPGPNSTKISRPIILYAGKIEDPDAIVLNPFSESITKSEVLDFFYEILSMTVANKLRMIQKSLILHAIESKAVATKPATDKKNKAAASDAKEEPVKKEDIELASLLSKWVDRIDATTATEFDQVVKKLTSYFDIYYLAKCREARVSCGLFNDDFKKAYRIRQKTWDVLTEQVQFIFDTKDFSEFAVVSKMSGCPKFDSVYRVLLKLYTMMKKYIKYIPEGSSADVDIDYMSNCVDLFEVFKEKSKFIVTSSVPATNGAASVNPIPTIGGVTRPAVIAPGMPMSGMQPMMGITQPPAMAPAMSPVPSAMPMIGIPSMTPSIGMGAGVQPVMTPVPAIKTNAYVSDW